MPVRVAFVLAKEVAYRSRKAWGRKTYFLKTRVKPSVLASNAVPFTLLLILSLPFGLMVLMAPAEGAREVFVVTTTMVLGLEGVLALFTAISFTATFTSERLVEALRPLPIDRLSLSRAYFEAMILYWGGLSSLAPLIPVTIAGLMRSFEGRLGLLTLAAYMVAAVLATLTFFSAGILLGTYASLVRRKTSLRVLSTAGWVAVFAFWLLMQRILSVVEVAEPSGSIQGPWWLALLPFFGCLMIEAKPLLSLASLALSLAITALTVKLMVQRFDRVLAPLSVPTSAPSWAGLSVRGPVPGYVVKDLRLLAREPRRLASVIYVLIFPLFLLSGGGREGGVFAATLAPCVIGSLVPLSLSTLYYVEGSAAPFLYTLPLTRRRLALIKVLSASPIAVLASLESAAIAYLSTGAPFLGLYAATLGLVTALLSLVTLSSLTSMMLPDAPSEWSEASISRLKYALAYILVFALAVVPYLGAAVALRDPLSVLLVGALPQLLVSLLAFLALRNRAL